MYVCFPRSPLFFKRASSVNENKNPMEKELTTYLRVEIVVILCFLCF